MDNKQTSKPKNAYSKGIRFYDSFITGSAWWSHLYMNCFWQVDDNEVAKEVLGMIPPDFSGRLLDVPAGTLVFTASTYACLPNASIVGVDYSREMLAVAEQRKQDMGLSQLSLEWGDVGQLPYEDESFDMVLSMNGFHAFPDKERALAELYRVLKPGGCFLGCFYVKGKKRISDALVRLILNRKGVFVPPHFTMEEMEEKFNSFYRGGVEISNHNSIMVFRCIK
ncbi:MAG: class I SAM-dependent methyltransferase [Porphyromonas sp.]|nr:class I SAM-dependent methyltransferase [Porphyromonas sp.]